MDVCGYYLQQGIWDIVELLYNAINDPCTKENVEKLIWDHCFRLDSLRFPTQLVVTHWQQKWLAANVLSSIRLLTSTDIDVLKREIEFQQALQSLVGVNTSQSAVKDLSELHNKVQHADKTKQSINGLSQECHDLLHRNLLVKQTAAHAVIQSLLCLWSPYFIESDTQLQDLYKEALWTCIQRIEESHEGYERSGASCRETENTLLCLLAILQVGEAKQLGLGDWASTRLQSLCSRDLLQQGHVHLSLLSRGKLDFLKAFTVLEDDACYRSYKGTDIGVLEAICHRIGDGHLEELFYRTVITKRHWVEDITAICSSLLIAGKEEVVEMCLSQPGLSTLWPIILLYTWKEFAANSDIFTVIDTLIAKCKKEMTDITLKQMTTILEDQVNVVRWCKSHNSGLTMSNSSLLEMAKDHSILEVIRRTTNLTALSMTEVREFLLNRRFYEGSEIESFANATNWQVIIFDGFCIVMYAFSIIQSGIEIEKMGKKLSRNCGWSSTCDDLLKLLKPMLSAILFHYYPQVHQSSMLNVEDDIKCMQHTYEEKVVKILETMQQMICSLFPLNFRVEIMENVFSLLFLRFEDLQNESSSESDSDSEDADMASLANKEVSITSEALSTATSLGDVFGNVGNLSAPLSDIPLIKACVSESLFSDTHAQCSSSMQQHPSSDIQMPLISPTSLLQFSSVPQSEALNISQNRSEGLLEVQDTRRKSINVYNSSKSTSDSKCARTNQGFVCSKFVVRDVLHCLKICLKNTSMSFYEHMRTHEDLNIDLKDIQCSVSPEALQKRLNRLSQYVSEAAWRLELLTDTQFANSFGIYSVCNRTLSEQNIWVYENDESTSESEEEASSRRSHSKQSKRGAGQECEKSSSSGAYSHTTTGGSSSSSHCKMKCSKRNYQHVMLPNSHTNIVRLMLSSQSSLAIRCLTQGDHVKARNVIQQFDVEGNPLVAEVKFIEAYQNVRSQLEDCSTLNDHTSIPSSGHSSVSTLPSKKSIEHVASGVVKSSSLANLLENFLSMVTLPPVPGTNLLTADGTNILEGVSNMRAIVAVDLALTLGNNYQQSVSLLDVACRHCPELQSFITTQQHSSKRKKNTSVGFVNFTRNVIHLLKEVNVETSRSENLVLPNDMSLRDLLVYVQYPLSLKSLQSVLSFWISLDSATQDFLSAMDIENERREQVDIIPASEAALKSVYGAKVNTSFRILLKVCKEGISGGEDNFSSHLPNLYMYLKLLISLWIQHCPSVSDSSAPVTYFDIFEDSVMKFVGRLVFEYGVSPVQLEPVASRLNLNLVYKLVQNFCPHIPSVLPKVCDDSPGRQPSKTWGRSVLNDTEQVAKDSTRHPETLVKILLTSVVDILQKYQSLNSPIICQQQFSTLLDDPEMIKVLKETSELALADVEMLNSVDETLSFLINMRNLLWLHSVIVQRDTNHEKKNDEKMLHCQATGGLLSSCKLEQQITMKSVGYNVGQLGFVSLCNLQLLLLGEELAHQTFFPQSTSIQNQFPSKLNVSSDPRIMFSLANGQADSPKVQVIGSDNIDAQLDIHMSEYLNHFVRVEENSGIKQLVIPTLVQRYHEYVLVNQEPESYLALPHLLDVADTSSVHRWEKLSLLLEFLKDNTTDPLHAQLCDLTDTLCGDVVVSVDTSPEYGIMLEYGNNTDSPKEDDDVAECSENSELLWQGQVVGEPVLKFVERHCWFLAVLVQKMYGQELKALDSRTQCLEHLCSADWQRYLLPMFCDNAVICAVHQQPPSGRLWSWLGELADAHDWLSCIQVLRALPQAQFCADPRLQALFDSVLCELATSFPSTECRCPWQYSQQIGSASMRAHCVLANMSKWPVDVCVDTLRALTEEPPNSLPTDIQSEVDSMLCRVLVYKKILTGYQFPKISSWYELSYFSSCDPSLVMEHLIESELCVDWAELHNIPDRLPQLIDHRYLALLLKQNSAKAVQLLESLPIERTLAICNRLIEDVKTISGLKVIVNLLLEKYRNLLHPETVQKYQELLIGIQMLFVLSAEEQVQYLELAKQPQLIVEEFLMNTRLEALEMMITAAASLQSSLPESSVMSVNSVDDLLRKYATKSLEMGRSYTCVSSKADSREDHMYVSTALNESGRSGSTFIMPEKVPAKSEWMQDDEVMDCKCCDAVVFTMFNRRHHCRRCGSVVCAACSTHKMQVLGYGNVAVRVCDKCYEQTQNNFGNLPASIQQECALQFELKAANSFEQLWKLTTEVVHNQTVRDEFGFEHAPSVSLCLSILKLHSDNIMYARFLLNACKSMIQQLWKEVANQATIKMCNTELDFSLIIKMVRSLATAAKVKFSHLGSVDECDQLLDETDLLALLVEDDCTKFIPPAGLGGPGLRKVRDRLVEEELWIPALDVSMKAGLDHAGIWAAWGKACLRAGCWEQARDKFSHCLDVASPRPLRNPPLLADIIDILQAGSYTMEGHVGGSSPSVVTSPAIMNTLSSLKNIVQGRYTEANPASNAVIVGPRMEPLFYAECKYYLDMYGSHAGILMFYMNHDDLCTALRHVITKKVEPDIFYEQIYIPCLQLEQLSELHYELSVIDHTLTKWKMYLKHVCLQLEKQKLLNVLHQLQLFMNDYVRAAMTCIRFYQDGTRSYTDLAANQQFLRNAKNHLEMELGSRNTTFGSAQLAMKLEPRELNRHIGTIVRQLEVTKFLCDCEKEGHPVPQLAAQLFKSTQVPTLFGNTVEKIQLAVLVILSSKNLEEGFGIAFRIIQDYHLNSERVYCLAGRKLTSDDRVGDIEQLIGCICSSGDLVPSNVCDEVLSSCVQVLAEKPNLDTDVLSRLIKHIKDVGNKISAYIMCRQLKSAYLLAVKHNRLSDVRRILHEAERLGQTKIQQICLKRLSLYPDS